MQKRPSDSRLILQLLTTLLNCSSLEMNHFITKVNSNLFNFSGGGFFQNQWFGLHLRWTISNYVSKFVTPVWAGRGSDSD